MNIDFTEWNKAFDKLRYRHDTWYIFRDFLDIVVDGFTIPGMDPLFRNHEKYSEEEIGYFNELLQAYIKGMSKALETREYYDFLGEWWESDVNMTNKFNAQFFTPIQICELMEELTITKDMTKEPMVMYDCCCGSGRFGLVHHHLRPQDFFFLNDLDEYAVKMTIVNMIMHGMRGVVAHMNTLTEEVISCWQVSPYWNGGLGYVVPYGRDLHGAKLMLPRGRIVEAPTDKTIPADETIVTDKKSGGGLDAWL